jgi:hypothetical protein
VDQSSTFIQAASWGEAIVGKTTDACQQPPAANPTQLKAILRRFRNYLSAIKNHKVLLARQNQREKSRWFQSHEFRTTGANSPLCKSEQNFWRILRNRTYESS